MSVFRPEFLDALLLLARASEEVARNGCERPVLVGGAAVEFHTASALVSGDFDFVSGDQAAFEEALIAQGSDGRTAWEDCSSDYITQN